MFQILLTDESGVIYKMKNPMLDLYNEALCGVDLYSISSWELREDISDLRQKQWDVRSLCQSRYAWAIPDEDAVQLIARYSPIVEVGAGTGYWAWMISQVGGEIECFDNYSSHVDKHGLWYPVRFGGSETADTKDSLFLCWPPYNSCFAYNCIRNHRGKHVIYIGEGHEGCTADNNFHEYLIAHYTRIESYQHPRWEGIYDTLTIWERND